jgi:hypothetical protein
MPDACPCIYRDDGFRTLSKKCKLHKIEPNFKGQLILEKPTGSDKKKYNYIENSDEKTTNRCKCSNCDCDDHTICICKKCECKDNCGC